MSLTSPSPITSLGTPPSTSDPTNFDTRADALFTQLPTTVTEMNALGTVTYNNAVDAFNNATDISVSASSVAANVALMSTYANAPAWVSGTSYTLGNVVYSPANRRLYRRIVAGAGTTDPSSDATNWALLNTEMPVVVVSATSVSMSAGFHYILTNVAATTATLPATPSSSDAVKVTVGNGLETNVIARNGSTIMGSSTDLTVDNTTASVNLQYLNSSWRLV